jgi:hypothetical protein
VCLGSKNMFSKLSYFISGSPSMYILAVKSISLILTMYPFVFIHKYMTSSCWVPLDGSINAAQFVIGLMLFHILVMISLFISYLKTNGEKVIIEPHLVPEVILKELVDTSEEKQKH